MAVPVNPHRAVLWERKSIRHVRAPLESIAIRGNPKVAVDFYCICSVIILHMISLRSELRRKLLTFFFMNRSARVYVRQLASALDVDSTNLSRELARLESDGLLRSETEGRQRYYSIDPQYPYLKAVFALLQGTVGIIPTLSVALHRVPGIEDAYLYGSFAKNEEDGSSDIDLLILGHPDPLKLAAEISALEKTLKREVNYTVLKPSELKRRLEAHDPFLTDVWQGRKVELIRHEQDKTAAN